MCSLNLRVGRCLLDYAHGGFALGEEVQVFLAFDLDCLTGILAKQDLVTRLHVQRAHFAVLQQLAGAHRDNLAGVGLLGCSVGDDDARGGLPLFLQPLDDHAIVQGADFHCWISFYKWLSRLDILSLLALASRECQ